MAEHEDVCSERPNWRSNAVTAAVVALLVGLTLVSPMSALLLGRIVLSVVLAALAVYMALLALLGIRGCAKGLKSEKYIWLQSAVFCVGLSVALVVTWRV